MMVCGKDLTERVLSAGPFKLEPISEATTKRHRCGRSVLKAIERGAVPHEAIRLVKRAMVPEP